MTRDMIEGMGTLANKLHALGDEARTLQTRFIVEVSKLPRDYVLNLPQVERDELQALYSQWLDAKKLKDQSNAQSNR